MRYTPEQFYNMSVGVETDINEAEHHAWRIINHLDEGDEHLATFKELHEVLMKASGLIDTVTSQFDREEMCHYGSSIRPVRSTEVP